jgi:hypothetical protein
MFFGRNSRTISYPRNSVPYGIALDFADAQTLAKHLSEVRESDRFPGLTTSTPAAVMPSFGEDGGFDVLALPKAVDDRSPHEHTLESKTVVQVIACTRFKWVPEALLKLREAHAVPFAVIKTSEHWLIHCDEGAEAMLIEYGDVYIPTAKHPLTCITTAVCKTCSGTGVAKSGKDCFMCLGAGRVQSSKPKEGVDF